MSRLNLLSWLTSAIVHSAVFGLLGTLLVQQLPADLPDAYGSRFMTAANYSPPTQMADQPVEFDVMPVDLSVAALSPLPEAQPVRELLANQAEVIEDVIEPPDPVEEALNSDELLALNVPTPDRRSVVTRPRSQVARRRPATQLRERSLFQRPIQRQLEVSAFDGVKRSQDAQSVPQINRPESPLMKRQPADALVVVEPAVVKQPSPQAAAQASAAQPAGTSTTRPAKPVSNPSPVYPAEAVRQRIEGTVILRVTVSASGRVTAVQIVESSGYGQLDAAARAAVQQWKFEPAVRDGQPVDWTARLPVRFRLD